MVILCSNLANDQDMIKALGDDAFPIPGLFTDACFTGVGEGGKDLLVATERKKVPDLAACINDGRLVHQMQKALDNNADVFILIIEEPYRSDAEGLLAVPRWNPVIRKSELSPVRPTMTFSRFQQYIFELDWLAGVVVIRSDNVRQTADIIRSLYANFQTEPDRHQSLRKFYYTPPSPVPLQEPSLVRRVAKELKGIGWERSRAVDEHFSSVKAMCDAPIKEWSKLEGIGKKTAGFVVKALRGE